MSAVVLAAVASLVAVVPAAAFSPSSNFVSVSTRRARTASAVAALNQYAPQAAGLVDVYDVYAPRDVYAMEEWAAQWMQKVSSER